LGIPSDAFVAVTVGRFSPEKAQYRIVEAADIIVSQHNKKNIYFLIVGVGDLENDLRQSVLNKRLDNNVKIIVDPARAKEYLAAGDIFLLPSDTEGQPVAMLEAMNSGLASIASDVGGVNESLKNGTNGFLIKRGDVIGMAEKIEWLEKNRNELLKMQDNAKLTATEFNNNIKILENLFETIYKSK